MSSWGSTARYFHLVRTERPDRTRRIKCRLDFSKLLLCLIRFNTIYPAAQHTWAEDGYLNRLHPLNIGGDIWLDGWLVRGWTWGLADL
jgi:hypothetical protein